MTTDIRKIAEQVAPLLGAEWHIVEGLDYIQIQNGNFVLNFHDGTFRSRQDDGKLIISGVFPVHTDGSEVYRTRAPYNHAGPWHSIKVSAERPPRIIANAICIRLLPEYEPLVALALDDIAKQTAGIAARDARAQDIGTALGGLKVYTPEHGSDMPQCSFGKLSSTTARGEVKFHYDGDYEFTISTKSSELAQSIAALLAPHIKEPVKKHALTHDLSGRILTVRCRCGWSKAVEVAPHTPEGRIINIFCQEFSDHLNSVDDPDALEG